MDNIDKLREIFDDLGELSKTENTWYILFILERKTILEKLGYLEKSPRTIQILSCYEPLGYLEFTCLMANCKYVVTDSGGLQEESTALNIPCFTLRENTERPCTFIENNGTNQLIGKISEIELKECNCSMDLWDGKSSEKIANTFLNIQKNIFLYDLNKKEYAKRTFRYNKYKTIKFLEERIPNLKHSFIKIINSANDIPKNMSNIVIKSPLGTSGKNVMVLNKLDDATFKDILHNTILTKKDINKYLSEKKDFFFLRKIFVMFQM